MSVSEHAQAQLSQQGSRQAWLPELRHDGCHPPPPEPGETWDVRREAPPLTVNWARDNQLTQAASAVQVSDGNNDKHFLWSLKIIWGIESLVFQRMNQGGRFGTVGTRSQQLQGRKTALLQPFPWEWHQEEQEGTRLEYLDKNNFLPKIISKRSAVGLPGDLIETWTGWRRTTSTRTSMSTSK